MPTLKRNGRKLYNTYVVNGFHTLYKSYKTLRFRKITYLSLICFIEVSEYKSPRHKHINQVFKRLYNTWE